MPISDYKKYLSTYSHADLKAMEAKKPIGFRTFFNLVADTFHLKRLTDAELKEMRQYLKEKLQSAAAEVKAEPAKEVPVLEKSPDVIHSDSEAESNFSSLTLTSKESLSDQSQGSSMQLKNERLRWEAEQYLVSLERDYQQLPHKTPEEDMLRTNLRLFIDEIREDIENVCAEPEILYPSIEEDRCNQLTHMVTQMQSTHADMQAVLQSHHTMTAASTKQRQARSEIKAMRGEKKNAETPVVPRGMKNR